MDELFKEKNMIMQLLTQKYVKELTEIWKRIFDENVCMENLDKLVEHASSFYRELIDESVEKEEYIKKEIDELKNEAENLKRLLKVDFELQIQSTDKPLLVVQSELDGSLAELRECLRQRREQIYELLLEQESLCDELGEPPRPLLADPLPTAEEIEEFRQHLQRLKDERVQRLHELSTLRREIKGYLQVLELQVTTETEDRLLNHRQIKLNKDTFTGLQRMHKCYGQQVQEVHDKIDEMREKLETLWERLDTSLGTRKKFRKYTEYKQSTYDFYYGELQRCQALKSQNIKLYVNQIRQEIVNWWDRTLKSEQERNRFSNFNSNCYTDDLLMLHEMELDDLKSYYENNKDIFELFSERKILWERMNALEAKASEPGRYNNRGGQLLKEEKERKMLASKLPKIELQITELVKQYEDREHVNFLVFGENILDVMANDWEKKRQDKEKLSSARKHAQTPLSKTQLTRTPMSVRNVTTVSLRKTPLTAGTVINHQYSLTTSKKRKLNPAEKIAPLAKRSLMFATNSPNVFLRPTNTAVRTPYKSPLKRTRIAAPTTRRRSGRRNSNTAMKRRSVTKAGMAATPKNAALPVVQSSMKKIELHDDTYDSFRKCIEPASRSSIKPHSFSSNSTLRSKRLLPSENHCPRIQEHHTLRTQLHHSHSPSSGSSRKLTTKNLPIII